MSSRGSDRPSLCLAVRECDGEASLHVKGEIDLATSMAFRSALNTLAQRQSGRLVVELSGVSFMDSSGLHALLEIAQNIRPQGGTLVLQRPSISISRLIEVSGTISSFVIED